jgi:adenylate cyclase class 2
VSSSNEVEIKFRVEDLAALAARLRAAGFREQTPRTHELNTLYDLPERPLGARGELLRLRKFGDEWVLTHKARGREGPHKVRRELETRVADGEKLAAILAALGYTPCFRYEKFRSEWTDGVGHVVLDETPIGNFAEIEGEAAWIDLVAAQLGVAPGQYITESYAALFHEWKARTGSAAEDMTFAETGVGR